MNAKHSAKSVEWYTPPDVVNAARILMGGIDFDPASSAVANRTVRAKSYLTENGLALGTPWNDGTKPSRVWCNPPGGKMNGKSMQRLFWERLTYEVHEGRVSQAVFLAFSIEALQTTQSSLSPMTQFPICIPRKRIRFLSPESVAMASPTHANALVWVPPQGVGHEAAAERMRVAFLGIGDVLVPSWYA